jgi:hypothetical protein
MVLLLQQMMMYIYLRFVQVIEGLNVGDDTVVALDADVHFVRHFEQGSWYSFHFCKFVQVE